MATINNFTYELTQSVSSSFNENDTLEFTFQAVGSANLSRNTEQKVDLYYSLTSGSPSWVNVADYPKSFGVGTTYATKSFSATITGDWEAVKAIITGSVFTGSDETGTGETSEIKIDYDQLQITSYTPKSELTDKGLLVFRSPSKYIKADSDGVEIKGGTFQTERLIAEELEVFGDVTIFGDFQASPIPAYAGGMTDIRSGSGDNGSTADYARGDHTHELTFDTIDNLLNNNTFTNPISTTNITASGTIFGNQIIGGSTYYDNAGNLVAYGDDRNSIIIQTSNNSNDAGIAFRNNGGAYSNNIYRTNIGSSDADLRIAGGDSTSTITNLTDYVAIKGGTGATAGFVGIGNNEPSKKLTVEGDISASGDLYFNSDVAINKGLDVTGDIDLSGHLNATNITASGNLIFSGSGVGSVTDRGIYFARGSGNVSYIRSLNAIGGEVEIGSDNRIIFNETDGDVSRMEIDTNSGKVGIGTSTPEDNDAKLTVAGNISSSGAITASGLHTIGNVSASGDVYATNVNFDNSNQLSIGPEGSANRIVILVGGGIRANFTENYVNINSNFTSSGTSLFQSRLSGSQAEFSNIGIGVASPSKALEVAGDISASDGTRALHYDVSAHTLKSTGATLDFNGTDFSFNTNDLFIDQSNSRIGIGTTGPDSPLEILSSTAQGLHIESSYAGPSGIRVERTSGDTLDIVSNYSGYGGGLASSDALRFATNTSTFGDITTPQMYIETTGNVGIGTTDPNSKLQVAGDISASGDLYLENNSKIIWSGSNEESGYIDVDTSALELRHIQGAYEAGIKLDTRGNIKFANVTNSTNPGSDLNYTDDIKMIISESNGNVGIGNTNPTEKLTVGGTISASGNLHVGNGADGVSRFMVVDSDKQVTLEKAPGSYFTSFGYDSNQNYITYYSNPGMLIGYGSTTGAAPSVETLFLKTDGKVGIGTTTPQVPLQIVGGDDVTATNTTGMMILGAHTTTHLALDDNEIQARNASSANPLYIQNEGSDTFIGGINKTSKVGIKTHNPSSSLSIAGAPNQLPLLNLVHTGSAMTGDTLIAFDKQNQFGEGWLMGIDRADVNNFNSFKINVGGTGTSATIDDTNNRLTIMGNGYVGLGTTDPSSSLHIQRTALSNALETVRIQNSNGYAEFGAQSTYARILADSVLTYAANSAASYFYIGGNHKATLNSTGLIVDGVISASGDLHLYGNKIYGDTDNNTYIDFGGSANTIDLYSSGRNQVNVEFSAVTINDAGNDVDLLVKGQAVDCLLRTDADEGTVGIGTYTPTHLLHITGSQEDGEMIRVQGNSTQGGTIQYNRGASYTWRAGVGAGSSTNSNIPSSYFGIEDVSDSNTVALSIAHSTQNVGIKQTTPKAQLHIAGGGDGQAFGGKEISISETWTTVLTIGLADHESAYVKMTINGKWDDEAQHSGMMFLAEYFISNGAGSYNEPGQIIRQIDNTGGPTSAAQNTDTIRTRLYSSGDTVEIQAMLIDADGGSNDDSATAKLNFHIMGEFDTIT